MYQNRYDESHESNSEKAENSKKIKVLLKLLAVIIIVLALDFFYDIIEDEDYINVAYSLLLCTVGWFFLSKNLKIQDN